jgi:hypothetical protein
VTAFPVVYYAVSGAAGSIHKCDPDGENQQEILAGVLHPRALAIHEDNGELYYGTGGLLVWAIFRTDFDGAAPVEIIGKPDIWPPSAVGVNTVTNELFFAHANPARAEFKLSKCTLDGDDLTLLVNTTKGECRGLVVDPIGEKIYITYFSGAAENVQRFNLDGSGGEVLVESDWSPREIDLDVDNNFMYWGDRPLVLPFGHITRAELNGDNPDSAPNLGRITGLSVDQLRGRVYFSFSMDEDKIASYPLSAWSDLQELAGFPAAAAITSVALRIGTDEVPTRRWDPRLYIQGPEHTFGIRTSK